MMMKILLLMMMIASHVTEWPRVVRMERPTAPLTQNGSTMTEEGTLCFTNGAHHKHTVNLSKTQKL